MNILWLVFNETHFLILLSRPLSNEMRHGMTEIFIRFGGNSLGKFLDVTDGNLWIKFDSSELSNANPLCSP